MDLRGIISRRISNLKRSILSSHVSQTSKPQVEFRYEILIEILRQNSEI